MNDLAEKLAGFAAMSALLGDDDDAKNQPPSIQARRLLDHYADLTAEHALEPGQLLQLKQGLGGYLRCPKEGEPVIVTRVFSKPIIDPEASSGSPEFGREYTFAALVMIGSKAIEHAYDHRIFEPYTGKID